MTRKHNPKATQAEPGANPEAIQPDTADSGLSKHASIRSAAAQLAIDLYHEVKDQRLKCDILKLLVALSGPPPVKTKSVKVPKESKAAKEAREMVGIG